MFFYRFLINCNFVREQNEEIKKVQLSEKPQLDLLDEKTREKRLSQIITEVRATHMERYLARKAEERLQKRNEQKAREATRKESVEELNLGIANLQKFLGEDKKEPWLKNLCLDISGGVLCQTN